MARGRAENSVLHSSQGANSKMIALYVEKKSGFTHCDLDKWGHAYPFPCVFCAVTHDSRNICHEFLWRYISYKTDNAESI